MTGLKDAYRILLTICVVMLGIFITCSITHSVLGPWIVDRVIAVDMVGAMTVITITILSVYLDENYLVDMSLICTMINFPAVTVLCKVYIGVYRGREEQQGEKED